MGHAMTAHHHITRKALTMRTLLAIIGAAQVALYLTVVVFDFHTLTNRGRR